MLMMLTKLGKTAPLPHGEVRVLRTQVLENPIIDFLVSDRLSDANLIGYHQKLFTASGSR